ncbi:11474_t:CDS:2 [Funneliformis mosseae]|uniref:11474_t:CDS:1 n=1 Tax=Funneliformis mosseae TaxID=27381 RepID=A0A9N9AH68_FUNMO|nr:11474_t:CDS:2 [Funneliformis mosseae]
MHYLLFSINKTENLWKQLCNIIKEEFDEQLQEVEDDLIEIVPESYTKIKNKLAFENFIKTIPKDQNGLKYIEFKVEYCDSTRLFYIQGLIQLEPIFGITIPSEANISPYDDAITLAIKNVKLFLKVTGTIDGRNEIERSRFIDTIFPYGKGRTDLFINCDDTIVCITEVKRTDLEYGKRDQDDIEYVYGIVSTGEKWYFTLVSSDNRVAKSEKPITLSLDNDDIDDDTLRNQAGKLFAVILSMLIEKITSISENSANKKQRLNELLH